MRKESMGKLILHEGIPYEALELGRQFRYAPGDLILRAAMEGGAALEELRAKHGAWAAGGGLRHEEDEPPFQPPKDLLKDLLIDLDRHLIPTD